MLLALNTLTSNKFTAGDDWRSSSLCKFVAVIWGLTGWHFILKDNLPLKKPSTVYDMVWCYWSELYQWSNVSDGDESAPPRCKGGVNVGEFLDQQDPVLTVSFQRRAQPSHSPLRKWSHPCLAPLFRTDCLIISDVASSCYIKRGAERFWMRGRFSTGPY